MKKRKLIIWTILIGFIAILQIIPAQKPEFKAENPNDLIVNNEIPTEIATILNNACYDCHSYETNYPWYAHVSPVKYLVYRDVKEGRGKLNFSDWESFKKLTKATILDDISSEVSEGEMPMKIYTIMHSEAKLSDKQRDVLISWAEDFAEKLFE